MTIEPAAAGRAVSVMFLAVALLAAPALADPDFSDVDSDLMRGMEDALKDLEPVLGTSNITSAQADAEVLRDGLKWVEEYFVTKGGVDDGVAIARDGRAVVAELITHLDAKNVSAAIESARNVSKNCRSCHEIYKP
jgi:cytochrome c556